MTDVAIRVSVVKTQVQRIERAIGKWIAFVRIVVLISRQRVVPLKLVSLAEPLSHTDREAVEDRSADSAGHEYVSESRKQSHSIQVDEARQMNAFRVSEVEIYRQVGRKLLLELDVCRVDPRVSVVFAEHANRRECRKATQRWNVHDVGPRRQALPVAATEGRSAGDAKLLHAIVCDRTNLRQHVLPAVENTGACSHH